MTSQTEGAVWGQIGRDAGVIALLASALAAVYLYDRSTPEPPDPDDSVVVKQVVSADPSSAPSKPLRLAITPPEFDDMGKLLDQLGKGYRYDVIPLEDLADKGTLDGYDVVFLTCGTAPDSWLEGLGGAGARANTVVRQMRTEIAERLHRNVRIFVRDGGTLYASDWRYQILRLAFPELVDMDEQGSGAVQELTAKVVDDGLQEHIGSTIHLRFDLAGWFPASFTSQDMQTYLEGDFKTEEGGRARRPLLVKIPFGDGNIIYTSFHNEIQNSATELELLKFLVFTTVTAHVEATVQKTMVQGGFSPQKQNMLSASEDAPSISKTYECAESGRIQFVLAFENRGAELELIVTSPSGRPHEKVGSSTLNVDIENAEVGKWEYSIRAKKVPYPNFPFTLTVWQQ